MPNPEQQDNNAGRNANHRQQNNVNTPPQPDKPGTEQEQQQTNSIGNVENANIAQGNQTIININAPTAEWQQILDRFTGPKGKKKGRASANAQDAATQGNKPRQQNAEELDQPPTNLEEWYFRFNELEKCYLLAMTVLSGAIDTEIMQAIEQLYLPIREKREQYSSNNKQSKLSQEENGIMLTTAFCRKTFTYIKETEDGRYILWKDSEPSGFSAFSVRLLDFIVKTSPVGGISQGHILERLEALMLLEGDSEWRIPRALGELWYKTNRDQLFRIAENWTRQANPQSSRVANLLFGAYEVETRLTKEGKRAQQPSHIIKFLEVWTQQAAGNFQQGSVKFIDAITDTYELIAENDMQQALSGIEKLLYLIAQNTEEKQIPQIVNFKVAFAYVDLARFGSLKEILSFLSTKIQEYMDKRLDTRSPVKNPRDSSKERFQQMAFSNTLLTAFFLTALLSQNSSKDASMSQSTAASYSRAYTLPEAPGLQDDSALDVLLASILSENEQTWRQQIGLLCSAMLINNFIEAVFRLLHDWAEVVLEIRGREARLLRTSYMNFVSEIILRAHAWNRWLLYKGEERRDLIKYPVRENLESWLRESQDPPKPLSAFATDVWQQVQSQLASSNKDTR